MLKKRRKEIQKKKAKKRKDNAPNKYERCTIKWPETNRWLHLLAVEQAPRGALAAGQEKKGELATTSLEFEYLHRKSRCEMLIGGDDICGSLRRSNLKAFPCENRARNGARSIFCGTKTEKSVPRSFLVCVQTPPALFWGEGRGGGSVHRLGLFLCFETEWKLLQRRLGDG